MSAKREMDKNIMADTGDSAISSFEDRFREYFLQIQRQLGQVSGMQDHLLREMNAGFRALSVFQAEAAIVHENAMQSFPQDETTSHAQEESRKELLRAMVMRMFPPDNPPVGFGISVAFIDPATALSPSEKHASACGELLEACRAKCCLYDVSLTKEEVLSGKYDWDITSPYVLTKRNGYCCYLSMDTYSCSLEGETKPLVCRNYDCKKDSRMMALFKQCKSDAPTSLEAGGNKVDAMGGSVNG